MCDCVTKVDDVIAIAALIQAVVAKLIRLRQKNQTWRLYRRGFIAENKWRAVKDGINGELIDFGREKSVPLRFLIEELLEIIDDVVDELGSRQDLEHLYTILKEGTSADRQLRRYEETQSLEAVVDMLAEETVMGC
jgi:carboxylate-amine ligase